MNLTSRVCAVTSRVCGTSVSIGNRQEVTVPNRPAHPAGDIPGLSWTYFLGVIITAGLRGMQRPALVTTDEKIRQRRIKRQRHRFPNMQRIISATWRRESAVQDPVTHSGPSHDFAPDHFPTKKSDSANIRQMMLARVSWWEVPAGHDPNFRGNIFLPNTSSNYLTSKRSGLLVVVCSGLLPSREGPSEVTVGSQNKDSARLPVRHSGYGQETALGRRFAPRIPPSPPRVDSTPRTDNSQLLSLPA
ncbi:hypothetical protein Bbelb_442350 [Branchiostoma belcheri]|nr:hypothetical protein Bbelb_442350 [Branchiostoma belcheri]